MCSSFRTEAVRLLRFVRSEGGGPGARCAMSDEQCSVDAVCASPSARLAV